MCVCVCVYVIFFLSFCLYIHVYGFYFFMLFMSMRNEICKKDMSQRQCVDEWQQDNNGIWNHVVSLHLQAQMGTQFRWCGIYKTQVQNNFIMN